MSETTNAQQYASASVWASQILMIANRINDIRYVSGQQDGVISSDKLALPVTPDSRIKHQLQQGRLWVWMPEQPGLVETLRSKSRGSALIGIFQNGQLNRPGFPGECFICELRLPDHCFRWKHNKLFLLL
ncbi:type IV pilus biogenesis protein PilM, partial [Escherichia coli]|uniref:type IV pilus biogenesis protein PilM n=1 Tax=Escherichia coli TaxID=562 RepID=UPI001F3F7DD7